jgi:alpha-L-rhamnosidase
MEKWLWSPPEKLYADSYGSRQFSQQTQVYALLYGLVGSEDQRHVTDYIKSQGRHSEMSFAYYVVYSMFEQEEQWALDYIRKYWGDQMKLPSFNGGWQEGWNVEEWTGDIGSTSHAWCSGATALLPQKVLGVEPVTPGWSEFRIAPHPGDLLWAKGVVSSPAGNIRVSWTRLDRKFELSAEVPPGTRAIIRIPVKDMLINGKKLAEYPGIEVVNGESGRMEMKVGEGKYVISGEYIR